MIIDDDDDDDDDDDAVPLTTVYCILQKCMLTTMEQLTTSPCEKKKQMLKGVTQCQSAE
jgi:hypothetical protein